MAFVLKDRVRESSESTGTGNFVLDGARTGFQSFTDALADGDTTYYSITDGTDWESGLGTWTESTATLARTTVYESSNAGSAVNWGAGVKDVFITYPSSRSIHESSTGSVGIGTQEPDTLLHLSSTSPIIRGTDTDATASAYSQVSLIDGDIALEADKGNLKADSLIKFSIDDSEKMRVDANGIFSTSDTVYGRPKEIQTVKDDTAVSSTTVVSTGTVTFTPTNIGTGLVQFIIYGTCCARYLENSDDPGFNVQVEYYNSSSTWTTFPDQTATSFASRGRWADRGSANYLEGTVPFLVGVTGATAVTGGGFNVSDYLSPSNNIQVRLTVTGEGGTATPDVDIFYCTYVYMETNA